MRPAFAFVVFSVFMLFTSIAAFGQEATRENSLGAVAVGAIPNNRIAADTAIVVVQAPKGTRVYSDTHRQDYGETTRFAFSGLKSGETFLTQFTVTFPSQKKASRLFYLAGGQQFTLVFEETPEARPTLALQRGHGRTFNEMEHPSIRSRLSDDGLHLLSWSEDGDIRFWDASNGRLLRAFTIPATKTAILPRMLTNCQIDAANGEIIADVLYFGIERYRFNYRTGVANPKIENLNVPQGEIIDYAPSSGHAIVITKDNGVWLYATKARKWLVKLGTLLEAEPGMPLNPWNPSFFFAGEQLRYACKVDWKAAVLTLFTAVDGEIFREIRLPKINSISLGIRDVENIDAAGNALYLKGHIFDAINNGNQPPCAVVVDFDDAKVTTVTHPQVANIGKDSELLQNDSGLWMSAKRHRKTGKMAVGRYLLSWPELKLAARFNVPDSYLPIAFSADGSRLVYLNGTVQSTAPQFLICDTLTGRRICETTGGINGVSGLMMASARNELWVANASRSLLQKFDLANGRPGAPVVARSPGFLEGLLLDSAVPLSLPASTVANELAWFETVYDRESGKALYSFRKQLERSAEEERRDGGWFDFGGSSHASVVSPDGKILAFETTRHDVEGAAGDGYKGMTLWSSDQRKLLKEVKPGRPLVFSPDSTELLYQNRDSGAIELLRVADGTIAARRVGPWLEDSELSRSACFSDDRRRLAVAGLAVKLPNGKYATDGNEFKEIKDRLMYSGTNSDVAFDAAIDAAMRPRVEIWNGKLRKNLRTIETKAEVNALAFSPDSRLLAYAAGKEITVLSEQGYVMRVFSTHAGTVGHLVWHADSRRLLSSSADGTIGLWDVGTGDELARLIPLDPQVMPAVEGSGGEEERSVEPPPPPDPRAELNRPGQRGQEPRFHFTAALQPPPPAPSTGDDPPRPAQGDTEEERAIAAERDWLVVTPEGLFDGTLGGRERVSFRVGEGLTVVPVDRFFQDFYFPGLWAELWRGERPMPNAKFGGSQAPKVTLVSRVQSENVDTQTIAVVVDVIDQGGGFKTPWLRHNGSVFNATLPPETRPKGIRQTFELTLVQGVNKIELLSASADGSWESEPAVLTLRFDKPLRQPALHVVAIGINQYAGALKLKYAAQDAQAMAGLFKQRGPEVFSAVNVRVLVDKEATREAVLAAISDVKAAPQDVFVLFLAGHGVTQGQRYYFLPADFHDDPQAKIEDDVRKTGMPNDQLGDRINRLKALKRIVIYDTCQAGGALGVSDVRAPFGTSKAMEEFERSVGSWLLAAAKSDMKAHEHDDLKHGLLTYTLLAGAGAIEHGPLSKRASSEQPWITVRNWFGFAQDMVPPLAKVYFDEGAQAVELKGSHANFPVLQSGKR